MKYTITPLITEKSLVNVAAGWYTFRVHKLATKPEIRSIVHSLYSVDVVDIRTMVIPGKTKRTGKKMKIIKKSDWKKIMIRLGKNQSIDAFQVTGEKKPEK